ncbi:hypothetical protein Salat_2333600 [Sesamum alatum]|uniref:Uncharacterized protein n=1 Tax=Sesamum alatum TaxID=300844 RepID=A0AAE2CEJ7_9LAMI|nr:hypothetical protein Salat_2333600 [Sesamum alatum]
MEDEEESAAEEKMRFSTQIKILFVCTYTPSVSIGGRYPETCSCQLLDLLCSASAQQQRAGVRPSLAELAGYGTDTWTWSPPRNRLLQSAIQAVAIAEPVFQVRVLFKLFFAFSIRMSVTVGFQSAKAETNSYLGGGRHRFIYSHLPSNTWMESFGNVEGKWPIYGKRSPPYLTEKSLQKVRG